MPTGPEAPAWSRGSGWPPRTGCSHRNMVQGQAGPAACIVVLASPRPRTSCRWWPGVRGHRVGRGAARGCGACRGLGRRCAPGVPPCGLQPRLSHLGPVSWRGVPRPSVSLHPSGLPSPRRPAVIPPRVRAPFSRHLVCSPSLLLWQHCSDPGDRCLLGIQVSLPLGECSAVGPPAQGGGSCGFRGCMRPLPLDLTQRPHPSPRALGPGSALAPPRCSSCPSC